ncbi:MAG: hypothetical protein M3Y87_19070 [Myxococcota bacterium]|nr:hypothetical protein [Myxococcota bacterium]
MRVIDRTRVRAWVVGASVALSVLLAAPDASAQTEAQLERARAAFGEGVQLTAEERWAEAAARFREVIAVRATPQVRFNLAVALFHSGEIGEAADLFAQVVDAPELDRRTRREAQRMLSQAEPQLGRLTIRIAGDEGGVTVLLDDREVGLERVGQPMSVTAGTHRVALRRGTQVVARREVSVAQGETEQVSLTPVAAAPIDDPVDRELLIPEEQPAGPGGDVTGEWWFWAAIGGGAAVVAGVIIGVAVASSGSGGGQQLPPLQGNLQPGVIEVTLP